MLSQYAPVILKLLKGPIYKDKDDSYWHQLQNHLRPIKEYFGQIGLEVCNYEADGYAYLEQPKADPDDKSVSLPRLMRTYQLSFEVTVLCVLLREKLRTRDDQSDRTDSVVINIEEIRDMLNFYLPDGNNEERFRREVNGLVEKVRELGFLRRLSEQDDNYEVLPILKAKIDTNTLERLKQKLEEKCNSPS